LLYLSLYNNSEIRLDTNDETILRYVRDHFTHYEKGYFWTTKYQSGVWNGKSSMFNSAKRTIPYGLLLKLFKYLRSENVEMKIDDNLKKLFKNNVKLEDFEINYDLKYYPYDYQRDCIEDAISRTKGIWRIGTGGGKCSFDIELEVEMDDETYNKYFSDYKNLEK